MKNKRIIILLAIMISLLGVMLFLRLRKPLLDNPDIRSYMDMASSGVTYDYLKTHLPKDVLKKEHRYKKEHTVPRFHGFVYYDLSVTNKACFASMKIEQKGKHWSYMGLFFFNSDDLCYAIYYEARTPHMPPVAFNHHWLPPANWKQACLMNKGATVQGE